MKKALVVLLALFACTRVSAQESNIILNLSKQKTMYLARQQAQYWAGRMNGYINVLQTLSNIMNFYESIPVGTRRQQFEDNLQGVFEDMPDFIRMFTVWKPNAIDGMDFSFIGRVGSTAKGQFAYALTRETGQIAPTTCAVVQEVMAQINGPNARAVGMSDPAPFKNEGKDTFAVRITVPIINKRINEVVGAVGCQLDIAMMQPRLESTIKNFDEVTSMAIYTDNGFIVANYLPERIGKQLVDVEKQYGEYINDVKDVINKGYEWEGMSYDPRLRTNMYMAIATIPLAHSPTTWSVMIGSSEEYIMKANSKLTQSTDSAIESLFREAVNYYIAGEKTKAQALADFKLKADLLGL